MISISKDKTKLDINVIYGFISNSYWGKGRTLQEVENAIAHSICFGVYTDDKQIGFARVVSDSTFFGFIMDVFILSDYRGKGYSKELLNTIINDEALKSCKRWMLRTADAHGLYKQFGFTALKTPEMNMERVNGELLFFDDKKMEV